MAEPRNLGTLVVSGGQSWVNRGLSILINGASNGPLSSYRFRLTFLASGYEVYSMPDDENDVKNFLTPNNNDYILVKSCQFDPNQGAHPQLKVRGISVGGGGSISDILSASKYPPVVALAEYTTKVHGQSMMFLLEPVDSKYKAVTHESERREDKSQRGPYEGMDRTGSWGNKTGTRETSYEPDLRYMSLRQIPNVQSR